MPRPEVSRLPDQDAFTDVERRLGRPMTHEELYRRVQKLNPNIIMETSNNDPSSAGFYLWNGEEKKFICAFRKGVLPEYSIIEEDKYGRPVSEIRGWRTILLRLLKARCLRLQDILRFFGPVTAQDERGKYWKIHTDGW